MQLFQRAVAVFCTACIAAELLCLLAGTSWTGRCIKAVAGLYILAVLLSRLSSLPAGIRAAADSLHPASQNLPVFAQAEDYILTQAAAQLQTLCETQCQQQFGIPVQVSVTLEDTGTGAAVTQAEAAFPAECTAETKQAVLASLQQTLGVLPAVREGTEP